jgi:osomolarity two-component system sensor histidine kinase SLN1
MPLLPPDGESPNGICLGEDPEKRVAPHEDDPCLRPLSSNYLSQHDFGHETTASPLEGIVVRIEVTDTGYGIRPKDMVESKLFCKRVR